MSLVNDRPARTLRSGDPRDRDPFEEIPGLAPNLGQEVLPHVVTFQGILRNVARTYYVSDEAVRDSWDNARFMRNDPGIMECLEQRQRSTALLGWHLEAEDEKDPTQEYLVQELTGIIRQIPNFLKYRENLLHALWYGKYGVAHRYRWKQVRGRMRLVVDRWRPVNGDKLVFRYDDGSGEYDDDQVGIRVGAGYTAGSQIAGRWQVERIGKVAPTDHGLAYFLEHWERPLLAIHKHMIEDAEYEAPDRAGAIHGVGIRNRLYWLWYQKQETLAWLMEYLERSAFGIEIWSYPAGNVEARKQTEKAALERIGNGRNIVLVPRHPDSDVLSSDVKRIEPGMAGADILDRIIREYFGWQIKRYILGQILTSETASTGLGSGVASIHLDTYLQIIKYDSINLSETLTTDLVQPLLRYNWPRYAEMPIRFVIEVETPDVESKLSAWEKAYRMGLRIRAQDVADLIGAAVAKPGEESLEDPQHRQAALQEQQQQAAQQQAAAQAEREANEDRVISHFFPGEGAEPYRKRRSRVTRYVYNRDGSLRYVERYGKDGWKEQPRDEEGKWTKGGGSAKPGETKVVEGRTYRFNADAKWERMPSDADPLPRVAVSGNELGVGLSDGELRRRVHVFWQRRIRGKTFVNRETGRPIKVARSGIKEVVARSADTRRLLLIPRLPELLRHAVYSHSEMPHKANPKYPLYHHFLSEAMIAGKECDVDLLIGEDENGNWFYQFPEIKERERPASKQAPDKSSSPTASRPSTTESIDPNGGEVKRNSRERYRAASDQKPGWRTVGGGARVYIGKDGRIEAGCPGLKGEDVEEIGEHEPPTNRQRREHRQDVAEHQGLEGDELTHRQVQQLEDHPHPETGKDTRGRQKAPPTTQRVTLGNREYEVKHDGGAWFFRLNEEAGWTRASDETAAAIERQVKPEQARPKRSGPYWETDDHRLASTVFDRTDDTSLRNVSQRLAIYKDELRNLDYQERHNLWRTPERREAALRTKEAIKQEIDALENIHRQLVNTFNASDAVLSHLSEHTGRQFTIDELAEALDVQPQHIDQALRQLVAEGEVAAHQRDGGETRYSIDDVPFDVPPPEPARAKINPRTRVGKAILQTAEDWGVPPDDLADALEYVWEQRVAEGAQERQRALEAARKLTGLYPSDVKRLKNAGYDHTSARRVGGKVGQRLAHFDEFAQEIARQYPILGLGNPDDPTADFAAALWEILDEDRARVVPMDDPGLLREAAQLVMANQGFDYGEPIGATFEDFRRRGEVRKYRRWLVDRASPADFHYSLKDALHQTTAEERSRAVENAAAETDTNPSDEQKAAGNYKKGKCRLFGLEIAIETPKGATRSGKDRDGNEWSIALPYHYGYIKRTESEADGDHVDVFLGPDLGSEVVFVIDQVRPDSGRFDEHKVMLGWTSADEAKQAYLECYAPGWKGFGEITPMTMPAFRAWLESGDSGTRIADQVERYSKAANGLAERFARVFAAAGWPEPYARRKPASEESGWDETEHPRDKSGRFTRKGQGETPSPESVPGGASGAKVSLTPEEQQSYENYLAMMRQNDLTPVSPEEWPPLYRRLQLAGGWKPAAAAPKTPATPPQTPQRQPSEAEAKPETPPPQHPVGDDRIEDLIHRFKRVDRAAGGRNFVHLKDLRRAFPELSKDDFDRLIQEARKRRLINLSGDESRYGISDEDREAAIYDPSPGAVRWPLLWASLRERYAKEFHPAEHPRDDQGRFAEKERVAPAVDSNDEARLPAIRPSQKVLKLMDRAKQRGKSLQSLHDWMRANYGLDDFVDNWDAAWEEIWNWFAANDPSEDFEDHASEYVERQIENMFTNLE